MPLVLYTLTIFLGAALLFVVQPLVARLVLPVLGGSPAVWNTAMVFFQAVLLGGYIYAHVLTTRCGRTVQAIVHGGVLLLPALALPIALPAWTPPATTFPAGWMLLVLLVAVGLPFFVVSTTGPLMQRWFSTTGHRSAKDPYFLYAASNIGSLLALLGYPFVIEPFIGLKAQSAVWTIGYGLFVVLALVCAFLQARSDPGVKVETEEAAPPRESLTWRRRLMWIALAFVPSSLMLGVTQHVSTDVAAAPLLWVVPLSIYLLTFIIAFSTRFTVPQTSAAKLYPIVACAVSVAFLIHARQPGVILIAMHMMLLFVGGLLCHKRLSDDRPDPSRLTEFYLLIAVGGVLGGIFNALLAPVVFTQLFEYPIAIVLAAMLMPRRAASSKSPRANLVLDLAVPIGVLAFIFGAGAFFDAQGIEGLLPELIRYGAPVLACYLASKRPLRFALSLAALLLYAELDSGVNMRVVRRDRTFFGSYRVIEEKADVGGFVRYRLLHGTTSHGLQATTDPNVFEPSAYYTRQGPVGDAMAYALQGEEPKRAALVGLGVGAMAAYARPGDVFDFYEIDPVIIEIANDLRYFSYVRNAANAGAEIDYVVGDARLTLGRAEDGAFDVIVLDAFTSDAIPVHLLTTQAFELYTSKLAPDGVLMLHISNRYLALEPVVGAIVDDLGLQAVVRKDERNITGDPVGHVPSTWVVVTRPGADVRPLLSLRPEDPKAGLWRPLEPGGHAWTDDHADIVGAFVWDWPTGQDDN